MIEGRDALRFALEPRGVVWLTRDGVGQNLNRNVAIEFRIAGAVDLAHSAAANQRQDFVVPRRVPGASATG